MTKFLAQKSVSGTFSRIGCQNQLSALQLLLVAFFYPKKDQTMLPRFLNTESAHLPTPQSKTFFNSFLYKPRQVARTSNVEVNFAIVTVV